MLTQFLSRFDSVASLGTRIDYSMAHRKVGVFWFTNDLRLHDQPALKQAASIVDELLCVYVLNHQWLTSSVPFTSQVSLHRHRFLNETLIDLDTGLQKLGQRLVVVTGDPRYELGRIIEYTSADFFYRSSSVGWDENSLWSDLQSNYPSCAFSSIDSHTLYSRQQLPFTISDMPLSFSKFRKVIEKENCSKPIEPIGGLPPGPTNGFTSASNGTELSETKYISNSQFKGGESQGLKHLNVLFQSNQVATYKEVRNSLDGWRNSCKLSPWLANGSLSVREVIAQLNHHEKTVISNEPTYWLYFELLWREFFQLYAVKNGSKIFSFRGLKPQGPLTSFYPERFKKWVEGSTPYPIVNACMNELRETGYLSNRGRQIVASCLVNELAIDWRYGADYFEKTLIDYDVASNWGNWQYLAGVGADTRAKRHFNLAKQTQQFDPNQTYINKWATACTNPDLDSTDAADWPIAGCEEASCSDLT